MHKNYGFTTNILDPCLKRIAEEAKLRDNFIVVTQKNTLTNREHVFVLARAKAIPNKAFGFKLMGKLTSPRWGHAIPNTGWRYFGGRPNKNLNRAVNIAKAEIQRIKNFISGRVIRVTVEPS
jgi:hypothetical protein